MNTTPVRPGEPSVRCNNLLMPAPPPDDEIVRECEECGRSVEALPRDMTTALLIHHALAHWAPPTTEEHADGQP